MELLFHKLFYSHARRYWFRRKKTASINRDSCGYCLSVISCMPIKKCDSTSDAVVPVGRLRFSSSWCERVLQSGILLRLPN